MILIKLKTHFIPASACDMLNELCNTLEEEHNHSQIGKSNPIPFDPYTNKEYLHHLDECVEIKELYHNLEGHVVQEVYSIKYKGRDCTKICFTDMTDLVIEESIDDVIAKFKQAGYTII